MGAFDSNFFDDLSFFRFDDFGDVVIVGFDVDLGVDFRLGRGGGLVVVGIVGGVEEDGVVVVVVVVEEEANGLFSSSQDFFFFPFRTASSFFFSSSSCFSFSCCFASIANGSSNSVCMLIRVCMRRRVFFQFFFSRA